MRKIEHFVAATLLLILGVVVATGSIACAQSAASTPVQKEELASDLAAVEAEIRRAEVDAAAYEGGLVKSLIELRLATLRQTHALLTQRQKAGSHNVALRYTVDGKAFVAPVEDTEALDAEIAAVKQRVREQQTEADQYSGGLVRGMSVATVATSQQTLAMLEQKRLAIRFGLPQYVGFAAQSAPGNSATPDNSATGARRRNPLHTFDIVEIDSRVTESNSTWWKFAWKLTLRNRSSESIALRAKIEFLDGDGFVVDDDDSGVLLLDGGETKTFTGYDLVTTSSATKVRSTNAKVSLAR